MSDVTGGMVIKETQNQRHGLEVADVFRLYGPAYRRDHPLPLSHLKVMRAIETCRTDKLGGHVDTCDQCGFERFSYNSCRNRHCPKCQTMAKTVWLEKRKAELLPVGYFHNVFTLPHELNPLTLCNKKIIFDILFQSVSGTLQGFAADPRHGLQGKLGFTAILHTWDQRLRDHIHLHCLIPGGAISEDGRRWVSARDNFLFPTKAISMVFRGKFIDALQQAYTENKLIFPGKTAEFASEQGFALLLEQLWKKEWVVYSVKPFAGPEKVLDYLGRYTHRVAIANHRITSINDGMVTFRYRDRAHDNQVKEMTLAAEEFIRRFLLHVLPDGYMRIRHFGFLANRHKKEYLVLCRKQLNCQSESSEPEHMDAHTILLHLTGLDLDRCPHCKQGTMHFSRELPKPVPLFHSSGKQLSLPGIDSS